MKNIIGALLLIAVAVLSWFVISFEFILLMVILLCFIFLMILGFIRIFKKIPMSYFKVITIAIGICLIGVLIGLFRPYGHATMYSDSMSENLRYAYSTDQSDRKELKSYISYFSKLKERDSLRLEQVGRYYEEGLLMNPLDQFHAAFIYHHSHDKNHYKIASALAAEAAQEEQLKDHYQVQWLRKASYDRYMVSIGKPEIYDTQNKISIGLE